MPPLNNEIIPLLYKVITGEEIGAEEQALLASWASEGGHRSILLQAIRDKAEAAQLLEWYSRIDVQKGFALLQERKQLREDKAAKKRKTIRMATTAAAKIAAAVILVAGAYLFFSSRSVSGLAGTNRVVPNALPAVHKAMLDIGGLEYALAGPIQQLTARFCTAIYRQAPDGFRLEHQQDCIPEEPSSPMDNALRTPRGGTGSITFAEGSTARLNAASALHFPLRFASADRLVQLEGEGNFEVKAAPGLIDHSKKVEFRVQVQPSAIMKRALQDSVLTIIAQGTNFTVRAYEKDSVVQAALFSGSLMICRKGQVVHIGPGQVYELFADGRWRIAKLNQVPEAASWTKDKEWFEFDQAPAWLVLAELSRWYNITLLNPDHLTDSISFRCPRNLPLTDLLPQITTQLHADYEIFSADSIVVHRR